MLPVVIRTPIITVYTYGVFAVLALFWFLYLAWKYVRTTKHREEEIFDQIFVASIVGIVVGRLVYMIFHYTILLKHGILALFAVHLYPGIHGMSVVVSGGLALLLVLARGKKYSGLEIMAYLVPAMSVALAILSVGSIFAGTDVGIVTDFPIRIKFALYDGLRHIPGLYQGVVYLLLAVVSNKLILMVRQGRVERGIVTIVFYWTMSFLHIATSQIRDVVSYQRNVPYQIFNLYFAVGTLLTSLIFVVYYLRSHFQGAGHYFSRSPRHGQNIHAKTESTSTR